jgi:hypothetical protein
MDQLTTWNDPDSVSIYLGVPTTTLAQWRHRGVGPPYSKFGKHVRYHGPTLQAWAKAQEVGTDELNWFGPRRRSDVV